MIFLTDTIARGIALANAAQLADKASQADLFVNVKSFGAKGDGITDDSSAIQSAIDYAYANKMNVFFPFGKYLVSNSIALPDRITLIGVNNQLTMGATMTNCETLIIANTNKLFVGKTLGTALVPFISRVTMKNLAFNRGTNGSIVFDMFQFTDSDISYNFFRDFDIVINGKTTNLTKIERNYFLNVRQNAITNLNLDASIQSITDSYIKNNYFSGSVAFTAVKHIDIKFANFSIISDNFFDFAYWGLHMNAGQNVTVSNNIFDYCFRGIRLNFIGGITLIGNHFTHINTTYASRWTTPTTEMQNTAWCGIHLRISVNGVTIDGNQGYDCQSLILVDGSGYKNIKTRGNVQNTTTNPVIDMKRSIDGAYTGDGTELRFDELNFRTVTTLPTTTGASIGSFDGNVLFYQSKIVRNETGAWKDAMGTPVS
jgi:hypothetical protein